LLFRFRLHFLATFVIDTCCLSSPLLGSICGFKLACDGLWEKFTNESAVNFVRRDLQRGDSSVKDVVEKLVKQALVLKVCIA
jgi:serine/threonine protein phosphatase PrpC